MSVSNPSGCSTESTPDSTVPKNHVVRGMTTATRPVDARLSRAASGETT
jgi:hypothetical protein